MICRYLHLVRFQYFTNLERAFPFKGELKYTLYNLCRLLVLDPLRLIFGILHISVGRRACNVLSSFALCLKGGADFFARILGIPFVHDITKRQEIIIALQSIGSVINRDQTHIFLSEHLHDLPDLQIVPAQARHVFYKDCSNISVFDLSHHFKECGTIKAGARYPIVCEMSGTR